MKKRGLIGRFVNRCFAVIGFLFVAALTCAFIFIYVGMQKQGKSLADLFVPEKKVKETYSGAGGELPSLEKIAEKQAAEKRGELPAPKQISGGGAKAVATAKPVAHSTPTKQADEYGVCPSCKHFHNLSKTCADEAAYDKSMVKKTAAKANRQTTTPRKEVTNSQPMPQTVSWTTADNTPRGGRTVGAPKFGDMSEMSALEKEAAYKARNERSLEKIRQETERLKNCEVAPKPKGAIQTAFEYLTKDKR